MYKNYFSAMLIAFMLIFTSTSLAQLPANCNGSSAPRLIIAGDSWAQYMVDDNTHNKVLDMFGHADKTSLGNTSTYAVSGSEAREWADPNFPYLQNLQTAITNNPSLEWVMLSIGGNDILAAKSGGGWYKDMDLDVAGSEAALFNTIQTDTETIMAGIWAINPSVKIMISGYDFPNFNVAFGTCWIYACPKREDLSRDPDNDLITDVEISTMMETVEGIRKEMADADDNTNNRIFYDNGMGLMHHYYGYDDGGGYPDIEPGATNEPQAVSPYASGGSPTTPTDRGNFRLSPDPIHLSSAGYEYKIKNQMGNLIFETIRKNTNDDFATFFSDGAVDGYVDIETNAINGSGLRMGDEGISCCSGGSDNNYRSILSFNTSSLPNNAQVTGASIYMIRSSADDNPFERNDKTPVLDIKNGNFGTSTALEVADGAAAASATDIGCFHGTGEENKFAIRIDVDAAGLTHINTSGVTQFRAYIQEEDWSNEYISFYDGGGAATALPLDVQIAQYKPKYAFRTVKKVLNADSTYTEIEIERGPEVTPREGYVLEEQLVEIREEDNGDVMEFFVIAAPIEHEGLPKMMAENGAPALGRAPFLDVSFIIVLPVELVDFYVEKRAEMAFLTWETAMELNSSGFFVEQSTNQKNWQEIGFIAAEGDSEIVNYYDFIHKNPILGDNYYRLKMTDNDGTSEYSEIRHLNFRNNAAVVNIFPNPFKETLSFEADFAKAGYAEIQLVDVVGRIVYTQQLDVDNGLQTYTLNALPALVKGNYLLQIVGGSQVFVGKVAKQ
ncbi:MAG: hypothetical protein ACI9XO_001546 [Paraglaciecola sp.]|jgi:hypothetical protein